MSHSYSSFRHSKSQSVNSSSSSHQRVAYGTRSTSTGTPPQTPTIRVTSPVPDAVGVIDIWDPEVTDDEPLQTSPKSYSFRYKDEKHKQQQQQQQQQQPEKKKNFSDSSMQADPADVSEVGSVSNSAANNNKSSAPTSPSTLPAEAQFGSSGRMNLRDGSPVDDDGLKTAGESEESSDCDETSQISAVTQVPRCDSQRSPEIDEAEEDEAAGVEELQQQQHTTTTPLIDQKSDQLITNIDGPGDNEAAAVQKEAEAASVLASAVDEVAFDPHRRWDESHPHDGKPVKRVQFRSLSLVPGSSASQSVTGDISSDPRSGAGVRNGAGRRYSSLDNTGAGNTSAPLDLFPTTFAFVELASGGKMLSPTPESALESAQSPQQEGDLLSATAEEAAAASTTTTTSVTEENEEEEEEKEEEEEEVADEKQQSSHAMTDLSVTVEEVDEGGCRDHDPTCDLFDRLNALKNDEELMDLATGFVLQLLRSAQEEALRRGHVPSKMEQKSKMSLELQHVAVPKGRNNRKWYSRLRTLLLRTLTCTCVPTHPNIQSPLSN